MTVYVNVHSQQQHIVLHQHPKLGLTLELDGAGQFSEHYEYRYHECLGVVPMLHIDAREIFIGGGGDGLLATRLLKFNEVERIVLCDYDPMVTSLAQTQPNLVALNEGSLNDERVTVVNQDAVAYLKNSTDKYDLILCDFPDPLSDALGRLYAQSLYRFIRSRLKENGILCVQTTMSLPACKIIQNTVASVFNHTKYYRTGYVAQGWSGFLLASDKPLKRIRNTPHWTRYLDDDVVETLFLIPKDEYYHSEKINTDENNELVRETVLDHFLDVLSRPYVHNADYRMIYIGDNDIIHEQYLPTFLTYCIERYPTIVFLDRAMKEEYLGLLSDRGFEYRRSYERIGLSFNASTLEKIDQIWNRINDNSITEIEAHYCCPSDHPDIKTLAEQYIQQAVSLHLEVPESERILSQEAWYLIVRDCDDRAVLLLALTLLEGQEVEIEYVYGCGTARSNVLAMLMGIKFIGKQFGKRLDFVVGTPQLAKFMLKLGAQSEGWEDVYVLDNVKKDSPSRQADRNTAVMDSQRQKATAEMVLES